MTTAHSMALCLWLLVAIVTVTNAGPTIHYETQRCLEQDHTLPTRHFYFNGSELPIILESSSRVSHQIANHILRILLEEAIGYERVTIIKSGSYNSMNAERILNRVSGCSSPRCRTPTGVPETMVNIETWMPAGFNMEPWVNSGNLEDCGPLGPTGRFGWFLPNFYVQDRWRQNREITDHWKTLTMENGVKRLAQPNNMNKLRRWGRRHCKDSDCVDGILKPNQNCRRYNSKCALLLAEFPAEQQRVLKQQIKKLSLNVDIAWIGDNLEKYVHNATEEKKPTLFFSWQPNVLTSTNKYTRVKLPQCNHAPTAPPEDCDFEINQPSKVVWSQLKKSTPEAFHLISQFSFSHIQYETMLQQYDRMQYHPWSKNSQPHNDSYYRYACDWIKNNTRIWKTWIPKNLQKKTTLYIGGLLPLSLPWPQPGLVPAVTMAQDLINSNNSVLKDYQLEIIRGNTKCQPTESMNLFMNYVRNTTHKIAGVLGPGCADVAEPIANIASYFNMIVISYGVDNIELTETKTKKYRNFFRTMPQVSQYGNAYVDIFKQLNWVQVAMLTDDYQQLFYNFLDRLFLEKKIEQVFKGHIPRKYSSEDIKQHLQGIKDKNAKIIIMYTAPTRHNLAAQIMCEAYHQGMTKKNGYQWFIPGWYNMEWWDTDFYSEYQVRCKTVQMIEAVDGYIELSNAQYDSDNTTVIGNMTVKQWKRSYIRACYEVRRAKNITQPIYSELASYAYDAMWVYALALDKLLKNDKTMVENFHTNTAVWALRKQISQTNFQGVSGKIFFPGLGQNSTEFSRDRPGRVLIKRFYLMYNKTKLIGTYEPQKNNEIELRWLPNLKPDRIPDGSQENAQVPCAIEGFRAFLGTTCELAIVVANLFGIAGLIILMVTGFIIFKRRYDKKFKATRDRMEELGLLSETLNWLALDEWEMPRDKVVLNRKLGEGAFGTVYGGEALIDDGWVAVAVKTLKIGSTIEEKLDFLSEAEMMKRFDHDNIVKLLGVCTRGEPAYAVMEFMLYGDLKTYLLARRQLVGSDTPEAKDITPMKLTRMALDVAKGMNYLAEKNYIHRDLACRNCLVHASKMVKIGDFGMTRPLYDHDYYRFNRRGMLPVRWMSPESLSDGKFTYQSDVWSYGVLLYEIVTFGSFPYQGLSNNEVLEFVKNGNKIGLPIECNEILKNLLNNCWNYEGMKRPSSAQIIQILESNPELIKPMLDAPMTAIACEESKSFEFNIPAKSNNPNASRFPGLNRRKIFTRQGSSLSQDFRVEEQASPTPSEGSVPNFFSSRVRHPSSPEGFMGIANDPVPLFLRSSNHYTAAPTKHNGGINCTGADAAAVPLINPGSKHILNGPECAIISEETNNTDIPGKNQDFSEEDAERRDYFHECHTGSPNQIQLISLPHSLEERGDSDYCSDNSREVWHNVSQV